MTTNSNPQAKKVPVKTLLHGETLVDDYAWMKDLNDPDLLPHLRSENEHADAFMADTADLQERIFQEIKGRMKEDDTSVPVRRGKYLYYSRSEAGKQYTISCRRKVKAPKGMVEAPEEILLDVNVLAEGKTYFSLGSTAVSPSGNFMAYSYDDNGYRQYTLVVKNLRTGELLSTRAERVTSVVWAADNRTLFYTTEDAQTKRSNQVYRHKIGTKRHELISEEKNEFFRIGLGKSRSGKYIYLQSGSHTTSTMSRIPADKPRSAFRSMMQRVQNNTYEVDDDGKFFYILTNEDAKDGRLFRTPINRPGRKNWVEILAHRPGVLLEGIDLFADHMVVYEKDNGLKKIRIVEKASGDTHFIDFPEPAYEVSPAANATFEATSLRLGYQSMVTPSSVQEYDMVTRQWTVLKETDIPGYDKSQYVSERLWATANDGTKVPVSIVYKKGIEKNGKNFLHLYGYGSYGFGMPTTFSAGRLSLLSRGYVFAIAHIRGGNELGETWREDGKLKKKMNTFTDFIACGDFLVAEGFTSHDLMTMEGGSAGGLLMGAVLNLRPNNFVKAALIQVPFVDVINTMLDETLPLTVGEFEEWGNPKVAADYATIRTYSPYENIQRTAYSGILVKSALKDSQVGYWEPAKYTAKMREMKTDGNPLIFKILLEGGGHGGLSGRYDAIKEVAFNYAFMLKMVGYKGE